MVKRMNCMSCKGPYHEATGHVWAPGAVVCGPCIKRFYAWVKQHTAPRKGRMVNFYEAAATSIREGVYPKAA